MKPLHVLKFLLVAIVITGCEVFSTTSYIFENRSDEEVRIFIKFAPTSPMLRDTTISMAPNSTLPWADLDRIGSNNFHDVSALLETYDSIVAINQNNKISKSMREEGEWSFRVIKEDLAAYTLVIDESDF